MTAGDLSLTRGGVTARPQVPRGTAERPRLTYDDGYSVLVSGSNPFRSEFAYFGVSRVYTRRLTRLQGAQGREGWQRAI